MAMHKADISKTAPAVTPDAEHVRLGAVKAAYPSCQIRLIGSAKGPLTPALSQQARLGELATPRNRIRKRMRMGRGGRPCPLKCGTLPSPLAGEGGQHSGRVRGGHTIAVNGFFTYGRRFPQVAFQHRPFCNGLSTKNILNANTVNGGPPIYFLPQICEFFCDSGRILHFKKSVKYRSRLPLT